MPANWCKEDKNLRREQARQTKALVEEQRKNKKFKLIKISDTPPTWKEIEIK